MYCSFEDLDEKVVRSKGGKIKQIKYVRRKTGTGLKAAKEFVESIEQKTEEKIVQNLGQETLLRRSFIFALRELHADCPRYYPREELVEHETRLRNGEKIPGDHRGIQDRFSKFCQDMGIYKISEMNKLKRLWFSSWQDW